MERHRVGTVGIVRAAQRGIRLSSVVTRGKLRTGLPRYLLKALDPPLVLD